MIRSLAVPLAVVVLAPPAAAQFAHTLVAKTGDATPGTTAGASYLSFRAPTVNSSGQVLIYGFLQGTGVNPGNDTGLWVGAAGGLELAAQEGTGDPPGS